MDIAAIGAAIAVRFGPTVITAPSGEIAIRVATTSLPTGLGALPASFVFPPNTGALAFGASQRTAVLKYGVDFVRNTGVADPRDLVALGSWLSVLIEALVGATQLGGTVAFAWIESFESGEFTYAGETCHGIRFVVSVTITEGISAVA